MVAQRFAIVQHDLLQRLTVQAHLGQVGVGLDLLQVPHTGGRRHLHKPLEACVAGHKVCLTVDLHHCADISLHQHPDQPLGRIAPLELGRLRPAHGRCLLLQPLFGLRQIVVVQFERFLAVGKGVARLFAQRRERTLLGRCVQPDASGREQSGKPVEKRAILRIEVDQHALRAIKYCTGHCGQVGGTVRTQHHLRIVILGVYLVGEADRFWRIAERDTVLAVCVLADPLDNAFRLDGGVRRQDEYYRFTHRFNKA
uniref:Uncharacterized protein n=1 Tax=Anopheles coluzzii TaxID=1518534 RepID=A0A8W7P7T7_ANOCL